MRVQRIERGQAAPPCDGCAGIAARRCGGRERLERVACLLRQARTLVLHPAFELLRFIQIEAVEERRAVYLHRARAIAHPQSLFEDLHVACNGLGIEAQLRRAEEQLRLVEIAPQRVAGLLEETAAVLGVALGPEVGDQLVPAHPILARSGEEGEEGERLALHGRSRERSAVRFNRQSAEGPELQHRTHSFDRFLTGVSPRAANIAPFSAVANANAVGTAPQRLRTS